MGESGDSVLKVVQLFIDNINESTKSTSKELDRLSGEVGGVKTKIITPPRHEELSVQIQNVENKVDTVTIGLTTINGSIKTMLTAVRVAAAVMAFAVLLSGGIVTCSKYIENKKINRIEQIIDHYLLNESKEKLDGITSETDGQH